MVRPLTEKKVQVVDKQHVIHDVIYYNAFNRIKSLSHEREIWKTSDLCRILGYLKGAFFVAQFYCPSQQMCCTYVRAFLPKRKKIEGCFVGGKVCRK